MALQINLMPDPSLHNFFYDTGPWEMVFYICQINELWFLSEMEILQGIYRERT